MHIENYKKSMIAKAQKFIGRKIAAEITGGVNNMLPDISNIIVDYSDLVRAARLLFNTVHFLYDAQIKYDIDLS